MQSGGVGRDGAVEEGRLINSSDQVEDMAGKSAKTKRGVVAARRAPVKAKTKAKLPPKKGKAASPPGRRVLKTRPVATLRPKPKAISTPKPKPAKAPKPKPIQDEAAADLNAAGPVLAGLDLVKEYTSDGTPVRALDGISIDVPRGAFISIMGPSGSGKSTLLHVLGTLDAPTSGEVFLEGQPMSTLKDKALSLARRHKIGFVFQFFSLVPVLSAEENVALPAIIDGVRPNGYKERVEELISVVGLGDRRSNLPSQLSGGQQQRVAVARALFLKPAVLLCDEPTGNLDSRNSLEILNLLKDLQTNHGQTVVMVTHDPRAASFGDEIIYLRDGSIAERFDPSSVKRKRGEDRAQSVLAWLQTVEA